MRPRSPAPACGASGVPLPRRSEAVLAGRLPQLPRLFIDELLAAERERIAAALWFVVVGPLVALANGWLW
jgi:hypothetical protein